MAKLLVEVDDVALAEAAELLGTKTKRDTVNAALAEVSLRHKRLAALDRLVAMGEQGDFDVLLDKDNYRR
ncbi:Arc/MetJ family transcription regulator [Kitasatospora sp. MAA4]|uniref:type II toxin-antitoxin system VapB family antitoxin n=1 Tax=Kitasatospora sp. MAA4 TaxID=3035093 RepID=UPI0024764037|nr:type II toxin-antitoxin system VapB family antitoxin [Kitasatospora sp. MAA4]MDH6137802.1 Arc/MetJ family transcription regulator [Kitasatospora sp. MAA4]